MLLAQKQLHRPMEQKRGHSYKDTQLQAPDFWQRCEKHLGEKTAFSTGGAKEIRKPVCRRITLSPYHTAHRRSQLKMDQEPQSTLTH